MTCLEITCPLDGSLLLADDPNLYHCPECHRDYPVRGPVVRLLESNDSFYEGAYENQVRFLPRSERPWRIWPLWLFSNGYLWMVRRHVPEGSLVVELGCASGVRYFGKRYHMVGCDLSISSLLALEGVYDHLLQVDAAESIPLANQSADAVISSCFLEHIEPMRKRRLLSECYRVLRPGGKIIFLYDVETMNPLILHYKTKDASLYNRLFIEGDGHLGYQQIPDNLELFEAAGFRLTVNRGLEKTWVQGPSVYAKLADYDGPEAGVFSFAKRLGEKPLLFPYTLLVRVVDSLVSPWLPMGWARMVLTVCEKD